MKAHSVPTKLVSLYLPVAILLIASWVQTAFHELGHAFVALLFSWPVIEISFGPLGGHTTRGAGIHAGAVWNAIFASAGYACATLLGFLLLGLSRVIRRPGITILLIGIPVIAQLNLGLSLMYAAVSSHMTGDVLTFYEALLDSPTANRPALATCGASVFGLGIVTFLGCRNRFLPNGEYLLPYGHVVALSVFLFLTSLRVVPGLLNMEGFRSALLGSGLMLEALALVLFSSSFLLLSLFTRDRVAIRCSVMFAVLLLLGLYVNTYPIHLNRETQEYTASNGDKSNARTELAAAVASAETHESAGEFDAAATQWAIARRIAPEQYYFPMKQGISLYRNGDVNAAYDALSQALALETHIDRGNAHPDLAVLYWLGRIEIEQGRTVEGCRLMNAVVGYHRGPWTGDLEDPAPLVVKCEK